mgnify:CR=1 FL=1
MHSNGDDDGYENNDNGDYSSYGEDYHCHHNTAIIACHHIITITAVLLLLNNYKLINN